MVCQKHIPFYICKFLITDDYFRHPVIDILLPCTVIPAPEALSNKNRGHSSIEYWALCFDSRLAALRC